MLAQFAQTTEAKMVAGVHAFLTKALPWFAARCSDLATIDVDAGRNLNTPEVSDR